MDRRSFIKKGGLACGALTLPDGLPFFINEQDDKYKKIPLIDTHLHLWDLNHLDYPWLQNPENPLSRNFLLADYQDATAGLPIEKMVFVECARDPAQYLQEVDWVKGIQEKAPRISGMVAYFPLEKGVSGTKEMEVMGERKIVKGIRKAFMPGHQGFMAGIKLLGQFNWSYDLNIRTKDLPAAFEFAKSNPNLVIILDHIANPAIGDNDWEVWKNAISPFSSLQNVSCKISGMLTKTDLNVGSIEQMKPYFNTVLEVFGIDRVLFGGDWPVLLRAASYQEWIKDFYILTQDLTLNEKKKLYYRNATSIYRL
ncbi:amidohydrolase family protein [Cyclobacterium qasimii]|uniref:Amidohydrolase 2 n=2 Tax=Cyclobacterium qasimii TaxID=1350429 RepID=S7VB45_9BACT|nr:amidohydrolase family protein [Cyclobacterium qasimii]EPR66747.1 amidohydrolase 2 [Cyclobacterium qasimii M12-11B]GEO23330.1 amidohydrolase [Cyclobacterium qasimii]